MLNPLNHRNTAELLIKRKQTHRCEIVCLPDLILHPWEEKKKKKEHDLPWLFFSHIYLSIPI